MTAPLGHPDMLLVRIPVFAKNGDRRQEPVSPHFRGLFSLPVMPDPLDVILSLTQNHGFLRSPGSGYGMIAPSRHPDVLQVRIPFFAKNGDRRRDPVSPYFRGLYSPSRHAGPDPASPVLRESGTRGERVEV